MRKSLVAALCGVLVSTSAAFGRPDTTQMTCAQARSLVVRSGAIVLGTGGPTYDRFVSDRRFCEPTEVTKTTFAATRDTPQCLVGYRCIEPSYDDGLGDY